MQIIYFVYQFLLKLFKLPIVTKLIISFPVIQLWKHFFQIRFRPYKQMIERLNRTYKASYRKTNGFDTLHGANYDLALWVAYYNFLRPHKHNNYKVLNDVEMLSNADTMPGKWQLLIFLGQQTILNLQKSSNCS